MDAVGVGDGRDQLSRLQPFSVEHRLAGIGRAHDDVRSFHYSFGAAHRLDFNVQRFGHLFGEAIAVFPGAAVDLDRLNITHGTDGRQICARFIARTENPHDSGILLRQSPVRDSRRRTHSYRRQAKVVDERERLPGL